MAEAKFTKGSTIYAKGASLNALYLIMQGSVDVVDDYGTYTLEKSDIIGITDVAFGIAHADYVAKSDLVCSTIPFTGTEQFPAMITALSSNARYFVASMSRQVCKIYELYTKTFILCNTNYAFLKQNLLYYISFCKEHELPLKDLSAAYDRPVPSGEFKIDSWLIEYYRNYSMLDQESFNSLFSQNYAIACGFLMKAATDVNATYDTLHRIMDYLNDLMPLFLNESCIDLYDLYTSVSLQIAGRDDLIEEFMDAFEEVTFFIAGNPMIDKALYKERSERYEARLNAHNLKESILDGSAEFSEDFTDSCDKLTIYAGWNKENAEVILKAIETYRKTTDKSSSSDELMELRHLINERFFALYKDIFFKVLSDIGGDAAGFSKLPGYVRMFLLYGYMDYETAGPDNAAVLLAHSKLLPGNTENGIYSFFEWLLAIFNGQKEPSRNEFDIDYTDYLRDLRHNGKITAEQEQSLLHNNREKVIYELNNAFGTVMKIVSGRPSTFCAVFSEHSLFREVESCEVTAEELKKNLTLIRSIDYSAFYREVVVSGTGSQNYRFTAHVEVLPDIVLAPCIGTRGIMWQEIEGKKRTTPCRLFFPLFSSENVSKLFIRLIGEYRWDMCKRIQGVHWNDVSDPSLTSEYSDYLQFYKRNMDLSPDAKEKVKLTLTKYHNNYRDLFVGDYIYWIVNESNGSPRLNRVARRIMSTYCPFSAPLRKRVESNPLYKETIDRYNLRRAQELHTFENLLKKLKAGGQPVPEELAKEIEFWNL